VADAGAADAHEHLPRPRLGVGHLVDPERFAELVQPGRSHRVSSVGGSIVAQVDAPAGA
jgi:hypothetical protein